MKSVLGGKMAKKVVMFDLCVSRNSPAGSSVLKMLTGLNAEYDFTVVSDVFENPNPERINWIHVPLPKKPLFIRYMLFQWLAPQHYQSQYVAHYGQPDLIVATQGQFIECDIAYPRFCHEAYLKEHWSSVSTSWDLRRMARFINHKFNAAMEAKAFERAKTIVVSSKGLANELHCTYPSLVKGKVTQIPNPVNVNEFIRPTQFNAQVEREKLGFQSEDLVIIFIALGDFARKGLGLLLQAMTTLQSSTLKLLVVGGTKSEVAEYTLLRDRYQLSNNVVFTGFQTDIHPYLWASDIFIFPSAYETFCLAAIQAAAAGLPIVAPRLNGVEEYLQDGINGWQIERNVQSISEMFKTVINNREKLSQMGQAAHATALDYDTSIYIKRWRILLNKCLNQSDEN
jgi:glycosyltransferase involved in cell wall biosynthesis